MAGAYSGAPRRRQLSIELHLPNVLPWHLTAHVYAPPVCRHALPAAQYPNFSAAQRVAVIKAGRRRSTDRAAEAQRWLVLVLVQREAGAGAGATLSWCWCWCAPVFEHGFCATSTLLTIFLNMSMGELHEPTADQTNHNLLGDFATSSGDCAWERVPWRA